VFNPQGQRMQKIIGEIDFASLRSLLDKTH
jgi:hypothetical protein